MNLLLVAASPTGAGDNAEQLLRAACWLSEAGHGVLLAGDNDAVWRKQAQVLGLPLAAIPFGGRWQLAAARSLRELERRAGIDVLLAHGAVDHAACLPLHLTGTPIVRCCFDNGDPGSSWLLRHGCRQVIVGSQAISNRLIACGVKAAMIVVADPARGFEAAMRGIERVCAELAQRR